MNPAPKYFAVPTTEYHGYTIGVEKLRDIVFEIKDLNMEECLLTESCWLDRSVKIDYGAYLRWEASNTFFIVTVRKGGAIVGNLMYFIRPQPNMGGALGASDNGLYLVKEHRKGRLAYKMMEYAEAVLRNVGVKFIVHGDKGPSGQQDLGKFFGRRGYKPFSVLYVKELVPGEDHDISKTED